MRLNGLIVAAALTAAACTPELEFTEVQTELSGAIGFLDVSVLPSLADDGDMLFAGEHPMTGEQALFYYDGATVTRIDIAPAGYSEVTSVAVISDGRAAFIGRRDAGMTDFIGVYSTTLPAAASSTTLLEADVTALPPSLALIPQDNVALAENGTVAFHNVRDGMGAIWRGPVEGPVAVLRQATGTYFNAQRLDVNDGGTVAVQMEYGDPTMGLSRGILLFESPGDTLATIDTAIEKLSVGSQPLPSINADGNVAFALPFGAIIDFFDPPDDANGTVVETLDLDAGVYVATPTPFGDPSDVTVIADDTGGEYTAFTRTVRHNDDGRVVFQATTVEGDGGVFFGPSRIANRILAQGDMLDGRLFSFVTLADINNQDRVALVAGDFISTDRTVWSVDLSP
ncbi:MAG: hypothetical protein ACFCGT_23050 [Sandaracinaceae bacterium]